jgi:tetratricopeptide (TPR) repeat protein
MAAGRRKPLAFVSTSLREEDQPFVKLVERIITENGFEPMGTVGLHSAAPEPVWNSILTNIPAADCIVMAATPRYVQEDMHNTKITKRAISETVHAEAIVATILNKPLLIFVLEGTDIGSLLPSITQYITLRENDEKYLAGKQELIKSYFANTLKKIEENWTKSRSVNTPVTILRRLPVPGSFRGEKAVFVGREMEKKFIKEKLTKSTAPLSIVGIGGIGKSAVAFKTARECLDSFENVIDLYFEEVIIFDDFLTTLAKRLLLPMNDFEKLDLESRRRTLMSEIAGLGRLLIIAENYENVSQGLISGAPTQDEMKIYNFIEELPANVKILLTSRHKNNIPGEEVYPLHGLNKTDGRDLFVEIANSKHFIVGLPKSGLDLIEALSDRVGGHPLAIRLLAGSYQGRRISEIESMLHHTGLDYRNIMESEQRLKSIEACMDYSFNKLDKKSRSLLLKFVFFKSPFPTMAAEYIFKSSTSNLHELYARSFIDRNELIEYGEVHEKFWLYYFHPIVREYLKQKVRDANYRLRKYEEELFSKFYATLIREARRHIRTEGHLELAKTVVLINNTKDNDFRRAIELIPDFDSKSVVIADLGLALLKLHLYRSALCFHQDCLALDKKLNNCGRIATDYSNIGSSFAGLGQFDKALENYQKALETNVELNNREDRKGDIARDTMHIGNIIFLKGNPKGAIDYFSKALDIDRKLDNKLGLSHDYTNIANAYFKMKEYTKALEYHNNALTLDQELGNELGTATDYINIGMTFRRLGDVDKALDYYFKALNIDTKFDNKPGLARTYKKIITALLQKEDMDKANAYMLKYIDCLEEIDHSPGASKLSGIVSGDYMHFDTF